MNKLKKQLGIILALTIAVTMAYADYNIYSYRPGPNAGFDLIGEVYPHAQGGYISLYWDGSTHIDGRNSSGIPSWIGLNRGGMCWRHGHFMPCVMCFGNEPAPTPVVTVESEPNQILLEQEHYALIASEIAATDGPAAVQYLESLEPEQRELADLAVAARWAYRDTLAASRWVDSLSPDRQIVAAPAIVAMWARQDIEAAGAWAASLPAESRDGAWFSYCAALVTPDPARALGFVGLIQSDTMRVRATDRLLEAWYDADATAGPAWAVAHRHLLTPEQIWRFIGDAVPE
jgi:hypothetical protein